MKAIVIGASSGIGRELAKVLAKNGYEVGVSARRLDLLLSLQKENSAIKTVCAMDIGQTTQAVHTLELMIKELGGLDLLIINAGIGHLNPELEWDKERETIDVNVTGCCALAVFGFNYFSKQNSGHLVGISSIGALGGNGIAPAYNASKAFLSTYLEGLQIKAFKEKKNIVVTDIKPGFVDTPMAKGEGKFWVASPAEAAQQIYDAIQKNKKHAYVTARWRLIAWIVKLMPQWLYQRI